MATPLTSLLSQFANCRQFVLCGNPVSREAMLLLIQRQWEQRQLLPVVAVENKVFSASYN